MKIIFWLFVALAFVYAFYSGAIAAYQYVQVKDIVEETVQERWRLDKFERPGRVRDDILKKTPAVGVTLDERDVRVIEENRILRVLIRWSYRFLVFRGDALISIPISYDKAFEVPPGR